MLISTKATMIFVEVLTVYSLVQTIYKIIGIIDKYADDVLSRKKTCQKVFKLIKEIEGTLLDEDGVLRDAAATGRKVRKEVLDNLESLHQQLQKAEEILKSLTRRRTVLMPARAKLEQLEKDIRNTVLMLTFHCVFIRELKVEVEYVPAAYHQSAQCPWPSSGSLQNNHGLQPASLRRDEEGSAYPPSAYQGADGWPQYCADVSNNQHPA